MAYPLHQIQKAVRLWCASCLGEACGKIACPLWPHRMGSDIERHLQSIIGNGDFEFVIRLVTKRGELL